jgi:hypothetical protein
MNVLRGKESHRRMVSELDHFTTLRLTWLRHRRFPGRSPPTRWPKKQCARILPALHFPLPRSVSRSRRSAYPPRFRPSTCRKRDRAAHRASGKKFRARCGAQKPTSEMDGSALRLKAAQSSVDQPLKFWTPASKTRATAIGFHGGLILRLPCMTLCG